LRKERTQGADPGIMPRLALIITGAVIGLILTLAVLLACAFLTASGSIPETMVGAVTAAVCSLGAGAAGFLAARSVGKQAMVTGFFAGVVYFLMLVILGALFLEGIFPQTGVVPILLAAVLGATLGGVASAMLQR